LTQIFLLGNNGMPYRSRSFHTTKDKPYACTISVQTQGFVLICKIGQSEKISPICMPLRLTHADIADFTDRLITRIGCFLIKTTRTTDTT